MSEKELPSRPCVRAIIVKQNRICLCKQISNEGKFTNYAFPGGGIELNQDHVEAVKAECLEEVGIRVTSVISLDLTDERRGQFFYGERAKQFGGIKDFYYMAKFYKEDTSLYNSQGDGWEYEWLTIPEAIKKITNGPESIYNAKRIEALEKVADVLSGKSGPKGYRW